MREIRIEKVTINVGCGGDLDKIERAKKLLELLTNQKPVITVSKKRSTFGIAKGKPVGVKVTLRKKKAEEFLKKVLEAKKNTISSKQISDGNFSIGVAEYIELPGVKYNHEIGNLGFDVCVTLERPGYRVKRRKVKKANIGKKHIINKEDVIQWLKERGVNVV
ncbi:MAG: 50S ribosomal protein L5 [Candidatus Aenigmarchaeota archaeon]|jgi:large subunit ribosomal protein L5|nr:50S ribosomal protein L5 [Candidatus Aenigmarchaeota archaeon]